MSALDQSLPGYNGDSTGTAIQTTALTKRFGERAAIDSVDLQVPRGSAFGFLGPNGAGKTTMIRMLLGLTQASSGSMSVLGHPVPSERAAALARVGAIVEEPRFHPQLTGRENLRIVAAVRGPETHERIGPALQRVGLADRADEKVKKYSLGMRQRLGVARCLLADPLLLILDEPTNGLDPGGIQEFREMVRDDGRSGGTAPSSSPRTCSTRSRRSAITRRSSIAARSSPKGRSPSWPRAARNTS